MTDFIGYVSDYFPETGYVAYSDFELARVN